MSVSGPLCATAFLAALALAIVVAGSLLRVRGDRFGRAAVQQPAGAPDAYTFREVPPRRVDLAPGGHAPFDAGCPGLSCPAGTSVRVTPPDVSGQLTIATGIEACPDGTIHVSPVVAGASGVGSP